MPWYVDTALIRMQFLLIFEVISVNCTLCIWICYNRGLLFQKKLQVNIVTSCYAMYTQCELLV